MTRTFLIASVAALAITVPAQAERGKEGREQRAERAPKAQSQAPEQRAERAPKGREQRAERAPQFQPQAREQRAARSIERARPPEQGIERRQRASVNQARAQERMIERAARASAPRNEVRSQRQAERRARMVDDRNLSRQRIERQAKGDSNRIKAQARQERAVDRQARAIEDRGRLASQRAESRDRFSTKRLEQQNRRAERFATQQLRQQNRQAERLSRAQQRALQPRLDDRQAVDSRLQTNWQTYASRSATMNDDRRERLAKRPLARVGTRINPDWYDDYVPPRYAATYYDTPEYYYRYDYDDGYLYQARRDNNLVTALIPLLGGAYSVGQPLPFFYQSGYNVPLSYRSLYYDTPDAYYRYGGGAIYQVDPTTQLIQGIVALLTGQSFGIGQQMPLGYDAYNVPYAYRGSYFDTDDMWYRYDDGYIYGVDPDTRLIETMIPAYDGYAVGYPAPPAYAGYDYDVPGYYDDLYYAEPGYDYRYASGGIYQVDPKTQLVAALVALVTGQNFGVGQQLPVGYDAYNVPFAYRDQYYDSDEYLYRYADGNIYQVDPATRLIGRVIDVT